LWVLLSRVDLARLWDVSRRASVGWLVAALGIYFAMTLVSAWRWQILLRAQHLTLSFAELTKSFLVATFFNNFLPSNIGGDVIRIRDTSRAAGSKTLATTVVLVDRGIGLLGLVFLAAAGATWTAMRSEALGPVGPGMLWALLIGGFVASAPMVLMPEGIGRLLRPLERLHQDWVRRQILHLTAALGRFQRAPGALVHCFLGAIVVQAIIVAFYAAIARGLGVPVPLAHLAVLIPLSFLVQMAPVSVNGFGVREATFTLYFSRIGLAAESALALSFMGAFLLMVFSISGAGVHLSRRGR
jgi:uncharacterized membrane protein YbhN (UPF0104 family)